MKIDHIVVLVGDLGAATIEWREKGFTITPGGVHADGLTHNALVCFADGTYVELIAFREAESTDHRWHRYREFPGVIDYALAVDDVAEFIRDIGRRGRWLHYSEVKESGRQRPDGVELRWRSSWPPDQSEGLPFLIEDVTPRDLRVPTGDNRVHANGAQGVTELSVIVPDIEHAERDFSILFGGMTGADERSRQFDAVNANLRVYKPDTNGDDDRLLYQRGSGPVAFTVTLGNGKTLLHR